MKLAMIRIIAHHTSGEAKPLIPVHDHALSRSAVSVAPRFKQRFAGEFDHPKLQLPALDLIRTINSAALARLWPLLAQ